MMNFFLMWELSGWKNYWNAFGIQTIPEKGSDQRTFEGAQSIPPLIFTFSFCWPIFGPQTSYKFVQQVSYKDGFAAEELSDMVIDTTGQLEIHFCK